MQVRLDTVSLTDEQRRAIRFVTAKKRTKATREEARTWLEEQITNALAELDFRWNGENAATVDPAVANRISSDRFNESAPEDTATSAE